MSHGYSKESIFSDWSDFYNAFAMNGMSMEERQLRAVNRFRRAIVEVGRFDLASDRSTQTTREWQVSALVALRLAASLYRAATIKDVLDSVLHQILM